MSKPGLALKTSLFSAIVLVVVAIIVYIIADFKLFFSVAISQILVYSIFVITIYIYKYIYSKGNKKALQMAAFVFYGKLVFLGLMFFTITRFAPVNLMAFFISFAILFTIFLGLEIILLYGGKIFIK